MDYRVKQGINVWVVRGAIDVMDALRIIECGKDGMHGSLRSDHAVIITPIRDEGEE